MITIENWGLISYSEAWERQTAHFDEAILLIFWQHIIILTILG